MARLDTQRPPSKKHARPNARKYERGYDTVPHDVWGEASTAPPTYVPTITTVAPTTGPAAGGTAVTITGTNFTGATGVLFQAAAATSFVVVSSTTITCVSPAGTVGAKSVIVQHPNGNATKTSGFTYS